MVAEKLKKFESSSDRNFLQQARFEPMEYFYFAPDLSNS
jgi:hypothetical protein